MPRVADSLHCYHCGMVPITKIESPAGLVELCMECTLVWFPEKDVAWFEERHAPFRDHTPVGRKELNAAFLIRQSVTRHVFVVEGAFL